MAEVPQLVGPDAPSAPTLTLYIWPPYESALSIDPTCVAALLYLQATIPGRFAVAHCSNPDASPSGQLPYLTHGLRSVASFSSIVNYVSHIESAHHLDAQLNATEKAQTTARVAHVEAELGDLVAHVYYALSTNWVERTHPMLVTLLPIPQRYFLPRRIRESFRPRLEAVELWSPENVADEEEEERLHFSFRRFARSAKKDTIKREKRHKYAREQVLKKARTFFDSYATLLGHNTFFYKSASPTVLDIVFASRVHLLQQPLPDSLLRDLLAESYPQLLEHAHNVYEYAFNPGLPTPSAVPHSRTFSLSSVLPRIPALWRRQPERLVDETTEGAKEIKAVQRRFATLRWGFFAFALVTFGAFLGFSDIRHSVVMLVTEQQKAQLLRQQLAKRRQQGQDGGEDEADGEEYEDDDDDDD